MMPCRDMRTPLVLIGEDEQFFRDALEWVLSQHDVRVALAENGKQTVEHMEEQKPDVLILDLLMPESDGFSVLEHMRENRIRIPTIVLSNLTEEIDTETCTELGVLHYVVKSDINVEDVWPMIEDCLSASAQPV